MLGPGILLTGVKSMWKWQTIQNDAASPGWHLSPYLPGGASAP